MVDAFDEVADAIKLKRYISGKGVVHGNDLLFGVFASKDEGIGKCRLPENGDWYEWFSGKAYTDTDEAEIALAPKAASVFIHRSLWKEIQRDKIR